MSSSFPSLDLIPAFVAVMDSGSLSGAARRLRLSQPTVRRHIEAMEQAMDAALFTRAQNGLTPTPLARMLLPQARAVLAQAAALARLGSGGEDADSGRVRITASRIASVYLLPGALGTLRETAPGISIEIAATDNAEDMLRRAADIALRFTRPAQAALLTKRLPDVEIGLFHSPYLVTSGSLETDGFITDDRDDTLLEALEARGLPRPRNVVMRCDDPLVQIAAIEAGLGVGVCQVGIAKRRGLIRYAPQHSLAMPAWLVMHEDLAGSPRVRLVFDHLKAALRMAW